MEHDEYKVKWRFYWGFTQKMEHHGDVEVSDVSVPSFTTWVSHWKYGQGSLWIILALETRKRCMISSSKMPTQVPQNISIDFNHWKILVSWDDYSQYVEKWIHIPNHQPVSWHMIMYDPPVHIGFADPCRPRPSCARQAPSLGFGRPKMCRLDLILCNSVFQCHIWIYLKPQMTLDDFRIFRIARFLTYPHLSWRNNGTWDNGKSRGTVAPAFATRLRFLKEILPVSSSSKSRKAFKISSFGSRFRILWVIIFRNLADQDAYVDWWLIPRTHTDIYIYIYTNKLESDWITRVIW